MTINSCTILDRIRKCSLWTFLISAAAVLVIKILEVWNVIHTIDTSRRHYGELKSWGKIESTSLIIMIISLLVLLALLIASRAKAPASMEKTAAPAKKTAASPTKKATAKKASSKK